MMIIEPNSPLFFKAIYKKKYIGFFYMSENKTEVVNSRNPEDKRLVPITKCDIYRWSGLNSKNNGMLFENDIISINGQMGVVVFSDSRFCVKFKNRTGALTPKLAAKCYLEGDVTLDNDLLIEDQKNAEEPKYKRIPEKAIK
jgi:hypothetical protein